jgi:hypothetical protein
MKPERLRILLLRTRKILHCSRLIPHRFLSFSQFTIHISQTFKRKLVSRVGPGGTSKRLFCCLQFAKRTAVIICRARDFTQTQMHLTDV